MAFTITVKTERDVIGPLGDKVRGDIQRVLRLAGFNIERGAKLVVPVDTGATKNSIDPDFSNIRSLQVRVGAKTEYAPALEFGTVFRPARPFLTPALQSEGPKAAQAILELLDRG